MKLVMPHYCENFKCIADKCRDNCCIGWEIDIDLKTYDFYMSQKGDFGDRLKKNINHDTPCFILSANERCPFLNENNLCDIIINLGEDSLCQICSDHPRYFEWFDGICEGGTGLSCEESARLILSDKKPFTTFEKEIEDFDCDKYESDLYELLNSAREAIIRKLEDESISLENRVKTVLFFGSQLQENIDNFEYSLPRFCDVSAEKNGDISRIYSFLKTLEPMDGKWTDYLDKTDTLPTKGINAEIYHYLKNICVYLIWRYFLKGVFSGEILSYVKLMAISFIVLKDMFSKSDMSFESCAEIAKNYSKEIEYSEDNLNEILDKTYELEMFSTASLISFLEE